MNAKTHYTCSDVWMLCVEDVRYTCQLLIQDVIQEVSNEAPSSFRCSFSGYCLFLKWKHQSLSENVYECEKLIGFLRYP